MTRIVIDASIIVKWLVPEREDDSDLALNLLENIRSGDFIVFQPAHWLAEAAAVLARVDLPRALEKLAVLWAMELQVCNTLETYSIACRLSNELNHHLFDTLYHAVALEIDDSRLVTADERYYQKAKRFGSIVALSDFEA